MRWWDIFLARRFREGPLVARCDRLGCSAILAPASLVLSSSAGGCGERRTAVRQAGSESRFRRAPSRTTSLLLRARERLRGGGRCASRCTQPTRSSWEGKKQHPLRSSSVGRESPLETSRGARPKPRASLHGTQLGLTSWWMWSGMRRPHAQVREPLHQRALRSPRGGPRQRARLAAAFDTRRTSSTWAREAPGRSASCLVGIV
jgi:hypothetical protein